MKDLLTLFVLPAQKCLFEVHEYFIHWPRLRDLFLCDENDRIDFSKVKTPYYGYCYSDEKPDQNLQQSLEFHYQLLNWDFLVVYRKIMLSDSSFRYFRAPRIFRKSVVLDGLLPDPNYRYDNLHVIDGFLV